MTMLFSPQPSRTKATDESSPIAPDSPVETIASASSDDENESASRQEDLARGAFARPGVSTCWPEHVDLTSSPRGDDVKRTRKSQKDVVELLLDRVETYGEASFLSTVSDTLHGVNSSADQTATNSVGILQMGIKLSTKASSIFSLPNIAIAQSYFCLGFALQFIRTPLLVYSMVDLGASPSQLQLLFSAMEWPFYSKITIAVLSDCFPVKGRRRRPYLFMGWFLFSVANLFFLFTPVRSMTSCYIALLAQTFGLVMVDTMTDAMMLDRSAYESSSARGGMLVTGYMVRFAGSMLGTLLGGALYNKDEPSSWHLPFGAILFLHVTIPLACYLPFAPHLAETGNGAKRQRPITHVWNVLTTLQKSSVWAPLAFFCVFNAFHVVNPVWSSLWTEVLQTQGLASWQTVAIPGMFALLGMWTYKTWCFKMNWRILFCLSAVAVAVIGTVSTFGIVNGINHGDGQGVGVAVCFAFVGEVATHLCRTVQSLMSYVVLAHLCPVGMESTSFVFWTTLSNAFASKGSGIVQTTLSSLASPSLDTQAMNTLTGLALSLLPLALCSWLPSNTDSMWKQSKIAELKQRIKDSQEERKAGLAALRSLGSAYHIQKTP